MDMSLEEIRSILVRHNIDKCLAPAIDLFDQGKYLEAEERASHDRKDSIFRRMEGMGNQGMKFLGEPTDLDMALHALRRHTRGES